MRRCGAPAAAGFTLLELIIVVAIIGILAAIAMPALIHVPDKAKEAVLRTDLHTFRDVLDQYYADKGKYPESLQTLVSESYLRAIPKDPFTNSPDSWQTEMADPEPGSTSAATGIYDVKSGHDGTALDGSRYADW